MPIAGLFCANPSQVAQANSIRQEASKECRTDFCAKFLANLAQLAAWTSRNPQLSEKVSYLAEKFAKNCRRSK
jgi:hypothetical protein